MVYNWTCVKLPPEENAVYYVINGTETGAVEF